jgi:hypothetical protein
MSNVFHKGDGFHLSYISAPQPEIAAIEALYLALTDRSAPTTPEETAIVIYHNADQREASYFILQGDHRQALLALEPISQVTCMEYYWEHSAQHSAFTDAALA